MGEVSLRTHLQDGQTISGDAIGGMFADVATAVNGLLDEYNLGPNARLPIAITLYLPVLHSTLSGRWWAPWHGASMTGPASVSACMAYVGGCTHAGKITLDVDGTTVATGSVSAAGNTPLTVTPFQFSRGSLFEVKAADELATTAVVFFLLLGVGANVET